MTGDWLGGLASQAPTDPAQFTDWLDEALGRPMLIVALRRGGPSMNGGDDPLAGWRAQLGAYPGVRLLVQEVGDAPDAEALARIAQLGPDVLLVCEDANSADGAATSGAWRAAILDVAEGLNLFERMLLAWYGAGVTRAMARKSGYEDGFAPDQPLVDALAILAREAIGRETYRRHGSSPPCYL
ncbi:MAG TPA: hypothetical protein VFQ25_13555 [Ktedonobacterales bacterium]|nr:hypothetical protein [Ktedonobacterales bacterium]